MLSGITVTRDVFMLGFSVYFPIADPSIGRRSNQLRLRVGMAKTRKNTHGMSARLYVKAHDKRHFVVAY